MNTTAFAAIQVTPIGYVLGESRFEGFLVFDDRVNEARPGVLMVPNWLGPTEAAIEKAKQVAGDHYVVFVADMYGVSMRPKDAAEAGKAAGEVRGDRAMMRQRAQRALEVLTEQRHALVDVKRRSAIGFCFGGGSVLELARSGADVKAVVSFHGNLDTPNPSDARNIRSKVLVLHGADDPFVPHEQVNSFIQEMKDAGVDWQLVSYGGAVHSFTDPNANQPGAAQYHPVVARRAFGVMKQLFAEVF